MINANLLNQQLVACEAKSKLDLIPKLRDKSAGYIASLINKHEYKSYLEIGTAYGFSCLYVAYHCQCLELICSLEKDVNRYNIAKQFCSGFDFINLINISCFDYQPNKMFDFILIDGPKGKQIDLVEQYLPFLNRNGCMVIDNIYLKKIANLTILSKKQQKLLDANKLLVDYLKNNSKLNTEFIDLDDGLAVVTYK